MLKISNQEPELLKFKKVLNAENYAPNTQRLYNWQAKKFLLAMREKKVSARDLERTAELYLRRLRREHSRAYFLQACSSVDLMMGRVMKRPLHEDTLRKLQTA